MSVPAAERARSRAVVHPRSRCDSPAACRGSWLGRGASDSARAEEWNGGWRTVREAGGRAGGGRVVD
eukprot:scaffold53993_cov57-Phaeocystis_antarctica.AAC.6